MNTPTKKGGSNLDNGRTMNADKFYTELVENYDTLRVC